MIFLILGLLLFIGMHSASIFAPKKRQHIIETKGKAAWLVPYIIVSLLGLGLIIWGYGVARQEPVIFYQLPLGFKHLSALLMLFAMISFVSARISGKLAGILKHPQLVAIKIWALAHLLVNGDLASVVLFGSFLAWAVVTRISLKKRVAAGLANNNPGGPLFKDGLAFLMAAGMFTFFTLFAHEFLFGVAPFG